MARRKKGHRNRGDHSQIRSTPRAKPAAQISVGASGVAGQLALRELEEGHWDRALEYADVARDSEPELADQVAAQARFRLARRAVLGADFARARVHAEHAVKLDPRSRACQTQVKAIRRATDRLLRERDARFFPDTIGDSSGKWWEQDLLSRVRGWDGQEASVPAPLIMGEVTRTNLEDIYALGKYIPWHQGIPPNFTKYVRELKRHGKTIPQAAVLLWQGLTADVESAAPDWIEEIDVVIPMATSWHSYLERGVEVTETLAAELATMLCVPMVDAFERDPDATPTHSHSGYEPRVYALLEELRTKNLDAPDLAESSGALIVDDVVTYGATFEACATKLREAHPHLRCWGAALAYTETEVRRQKALAED